jgi:capsular exopolysaccharide synthesis family protein
VIRELNLDVTAKELGKSLTIKPVNDTAILSITASDAQPESAALIANKIAGVFAQTVADIYKTDNVTQLSMAEVPEAPANNTLTRDMVLAAAIAMLLVAGFAFVRFYLDDSVKHNDDVEKTIGLPMAGRITKYDNKLKKGDSELIVADLPKAIVSENIKSLRTNLQFTAIDEGLKTILVTSTNAGEGKSFVSANLAISFAQADKKVLLVDCDLRKGRVHKLFGVLNTNGFSNLLATSLQSYKKYVRSTKIKNLDILTSGTYPPNPSELLSSNKNKKLIKMLSSNYDIVIIDGAPVGGLADSVILSSLVDETIIVVKDGATARNDLVVAKGSLDKAGGKIAGIVFNMVDRKTSKYYSYYYSSEEPKRTRR